MSFRTAYKETLRSPETLLRVVGECLLAFGESDFYIKWVQQPNKDYPIPEEITFNYRFTPHFDACVGAINGSHFAA